MFARLGLSVLLLMVASSAFAITREERDKRETEVRAAETAFAKSMADRNATAFRSLIAEEAVFFGGKTVQHGKPEVVAAWKRFFDGPAAPFSWAPAEVEVLASGTLGMTSGPVYDPNGQRIGTFNSIWQKQKDGSWQIIFDKGCPPCECGK